jgi:hypothetical protein
MEELSLRAYPSGAHMGNSGMKFLSMTTLLRRVVAVLFVADGCLAGIPGITYLPGLAYPSITTLRVLAFLVTPALLVVGGVGLFIGKRWALTWLVAALIANVAAGYSFVPYVSWFMFWLLPIPFLAFVTQHAANTAIVAVAWMLDRIRARRAVLPSADLDNCPESRGPRTLATILRWASWCILALVLLLWPISLFRPIHVAGIAGNPSLLMFHADILDVADNRLWLRSYQSGYLYPDAFHIEVMCGGMPFSTDSKDLTPLSYDWRWDGFRLGYHYELLPYRTDKAVDIGLPFWAVTVLAIPVPAAWLAARLRTWRKRRR